MKFKGPLKDGAGIDSLNADWCSVIISRRVFFDQ